MSNNQRAVNFDFPLSRLGEALTYITAHGLIEAAGLHLHATAQWSNDTEVQCCATAWTKAPNAAWFAFCKEFKQECVSVAEPANITVNLAVKGQCIGPKPWKFDAQYFVVPSQPRHIEA